MKIMIFSKKTFCVEIISFICVCFYLSLPCPLTLVSGPEELSLSPGSLPPLS